MDLNGELGRVNGGCGVALQRPSWVIRVDHSLEDSDVIQGPAREQVKQALIRVKTAFPSFSARHHEIIVESAIPQAVGLGSWTQLLLALARALFMLEEIDSIPSAMQLALALQRGGTSGIGIAAFDRGGFIVDGGHSIDSKNSSVNPFLPYSTTERKPPPILIQVPVPRDWWFVVIEPKNATRLGGGFFDDHQAFEMNCPLPSDEIGKVVRMVTMKLVPGFFEQDLAQVTEAINSLQFLGFKKTELKLVDRRVIKMMRILHAQNIACGLSGFGPVFFCIFEDEAHYLEHESFLEEKLSALGLDYQVHAGPANNDGATVQK